MNENIIHIRNDEEAILSFKNLYKKFGYKQYKMSKFEEYDLYAENKNFLLSSNIITFTDLNGKLMALKPDVTLSIVKNIKDSGETQKVYYNENVYRARKGSHEFSEILQTGLECIGDIDLYSTGEVLMLAVKSLMQISENYILDISHSGLISELLGTLPEGMRDSILKYIGEKNSTAIERECERAGISKAVTRRAVQLASLYGPFEKITEELEQLSINEKTDSAINELKGVYEILKLYGCEKNINIDFSIINDMNYYNGIVFKGYVARIPSNILSGGRYDNLVHKFGKKAGAIGFAVYLDMLDWLNLTDEENDADVLVVYDDSVFAKKLTAAVQQLSEENSSVAVLKCIPANGRYGKVYRMTERGLESIEGNN